MSGLLPACFVRRKNTEVEPAFWWSGMKNPELQILLYGTDIATDSVSITASDIRVKEIVKLQNPNYLLLYLDLSETAPQEFNIQLTKNGEQTIIPYQIKEREKDSSVRKGFHASDVLYLIMPDRFANGDPKNDVVPGMRESKVDRTDMYARHGGEPERDSRSSGLFLRPGRYRHLAESYPEERYDRRFLSRVCHY